MKTVVAILFATMLLSSNGVAGDDRVGVYQIASDPPTCTNGDCYGPPVCTNGDCGPPSCTNGDCGDLVDCCCIGSNEPGTNRICCCPSPNLDGITCRLSLVLDTNNLEFHQTLAQETLNGKRPEGCDVLMQKHCDPPEEEVCTYKNGEKVCKKVLKGVCKRLYKICAYTYCGPSWFPFDAPAPNLSSCSWWKNIRNCSN